MRAEYAEMEKKLKSMESLLKTSSLLDISREASGVTYTFAEDAVPGAGKKNVARKTKKKPAPKNNT